MKISLSGPKQGYQEYKITEIPFDSIVDASCKEIFAADALDFLTCDQMFPTLKGLVAKLRHGGKLIVGGADFMLVAKGVATQQLNLVEANKLIHGDKSDKKSQISMNDLTELLRSFNLTIVRKNISGYSFFIEAMRE